MNTLPISFQDFNFTLAAILLVSYFVVDGMYAYYTLEIAEKKPLASATTGSLMHFIIAFGVLSYVQNYLYVIPIAIGSWIGTYFVVKKSAKK